jgi:metal-responsive CopG/Arc/MetJ family transcriptional regulator
MPKKVLVAIPEGLLQEVDFVAQREHRTRSDLIREALRRYVSAFKRTITVPVDDLSSTIDFHE